MKRLISLFAFVGLLFSCEREEPSKLNIVGGHPSAEHHPWFVQLLDGATSDHGFCGGTLIAPRVVITAAHCLEPELIRELHVAMGLADGINLHLNKPIKVQGVVIHEGYSMVSNKNDIAVLYLEKYSGVQFERPVRPIEINRDVNLPKQPGEKVRIVGLGNTTSLGVLFDGVIREVDVPVVDVTTCSDTYSDVDARQICAGDLAMGGADSCQGDSGGPLVIKGPAGVWKLAGVVSYGDGCAQKSAPGVYTRVAAYAAWIDKAVATLSKQTPEQVNADDISRLIKTHCMAQFGYLPFEQSVGSNSRKTIYTMDLKVFKVSKANVAPKGPAAGECNFTVNGRVIRAEWLRVGSRPSTPNSKVVVVATLENGEIYVSQPQTLAYHQDSLRCSSSEGQVILADQRQFTYIVFRDVFYRLGEAADQPGDNQTTWGCSVGDASVEIYDLAKLGAVKAELAARIHHRSIGTVSVKLIRMDDDVNVAAQLIWESPELGTLTIENSSREDIFTWKITCPAKFLLTLTDATNRNAIPSSIGSGFEVLVDSANDRDGIIRAGSKLDLKLKRLSDTDSIFNGCTINDALLVDIGSSRGR